MADPRVMARLDIKGPDLVKGIRMEGLRVLGRPEDYARYYCAQGIDELVYMDVVASLFGRNSLLDIIRRTAGEVGIPLTVGGGLRSIGDIQQALRAGADKVSLNTAAIANPGLIREASERFGSSTIVVSIEAIRHPDGRYEAYTDNGRESTGVEVLDWAQRASELGAGEIMLTAIDREGTGAGFDFDLVSRLTRLVPIPVIAAGGAGCVEHVGSVFVDAGADAVCLASLLHYGVMHELQGNGGARMEGNTEFLDSRRGFKNIRPSSVAGVKAHLASLGIRTRGVVSP